METVKAFLKRFDHVKSEGFFAKAVHEMNRDVSLLETQRKMFSMPGMATLAASDNVHVRDAACNELAGAVGIYKSAIGDLDVLIKFMKSCWTDIKHVVETKPDTDAALSASVKKLSDLKAMATKLRDKGMQTHIDNWSDATKTNLKLQDSAKTTFDSSWAKASTLTMNFMKTFVDNKDNPDTYDQVMRPLHRQATGTDHTLQQVLNYHAHDEAKSKSIETSRLVLNSMPSANLIKALYGEKEVNLRTKGDLGKMDFEAKRARLASLCSRSP